MKSARLISVAVALAAAATTTTLWALQRTQIARPLALSGTIEGRDVEVGSLIGGRVARVHVAEGDAVMAGAPLVTLETSMIDPQIAEQTGRVAEARARFDLLRTGARREDIDRARYEWQNAENDRVRLEALLQVGAVALQQYDAVRTKAATLRETLRGLENGSRAEDIAAAQAAVEREVGRLAYLEAQRTESIVRAPAAGVVQTLDLEAGDLVGTAAPVARLLNPTDQWVRVYVPEPRLGEVRVGQRATVNVDTWPRRAFAGTVTEIRTRGEYTPRNIQTPAQRADQVFAVKVTLDPAAELKPGMAALVTLEPAAGAPATAGLAR